MKKPLRTKARLLRLTQEEDARLRREADSFGVPVIVLIRARALGIRIVRRSAA